MTKTNSVDPHSGYSGIFFFNESDINIPVDVDDATEYVRLIEQFDDVQFLLIEIVFVDAAQIQRINSEHLDHNYVTDVITFHYEEDSSLQKIEGTIFGCPQQIQAQAKALKMSARDEFQRIIIHGLLHLAGYDDQSEADQKKMREREDFYLQKRSRS